MKLRYGGDRASPAGKPHTVQAPWRPEPKQPHNHNVGLLRSMGRLGYLCDGVIHGPVLSG